MRKIFLTSAGFENKRIEKRFLELADKEPKRMKVLFIPTAAVDADAIAVLPKCMNDLLTAGIPVQNVIVFDLHRSLTYEELCQYDAIYFCGGDPSYLLKRINDTGFGIPLTQFVDNGGIYIGVSAGSMIATNNLPNNLGYMNCTLSVHVPEGSKAGTIDTSQCPHIKLTNNQAILILDSNYQIVE